MKENLENKKNSIYTSTVIDFKDPQQSKVVPKQPKFESYKGGSNQKKRGRGFVIFLVLLLGFGLGVGSSYFYNYFDFESASFRSVPQRGMAFKAQLPKSEMSNNDADEVADESDQDAEAVEDEEVIYYPLTRDLWLASPSESNKEDMEHISELFQTLTENYYRNLETHEVIKRIEEGFVNAMDSKFTYTMTKEEYESAESSIQGHYQGIGAMVQFTEEKEYRISDVFENGPAFEAGVKPGDFIRKVNGEDVSNFKNMSALVSVVKGEAGTSVEIEVYRPSQKNNYTFNIVRREVIEEVVRTRLLEPGIGYLNITSFTRNLPDSFRTGMETLKSQGAKQIVFDLRENPGGDANAVRSVLDMLLDEGEIATIEGRRMGQPDNQVWTSKEGKIFDSSKMSYVILVNRNSASASELFSGVLRDRLGTVLIGETTYGKGSGTITVQLPTGDAVNITTFRYILPNGQSPETVGLEADILSGVPESLDHVSPRNRKIEEDTQLQDAVDYLKGKLKVGDKAKGADYIKDREETAFTAKIPRLLPDYDAKDSVIPLTTPTPDVEVEESENTSEVSVTPVISPSVSPAVSPTATPTPVAQNPTESN